MIHCIECGGVPSEEAGKNCPCGSLHASRDMRMWGFAGLSGRVHILSWMDDPLDRRTRFSFPGQPEGSDKAMDARSPEARAILEDLVAGYAARVVLDS